MNVRISRSLGMVAVLYFTANFNAQNTQNWVVEGIWGLDAEKFRGSGGGPASLGPDPWYAYWFDCELSITPLGPLTTTGCSSTSRFNTLLSQQDSAADIGRHHDFEGNHHRGQKKRPAPDAPGPEPCGGNAVSETIPFGFFGGEFFVGEFFERIIQSPVGPRPV